MIKWGEGVARGDIRKNNYLFGNRSADGLLIIFLFDCL